MARLEVRGRRTGRLISFPVMVADFEGERYVVAMLGEGTGWVANVRAASGHAVISQGRPEGVWLDEVPEHERPPILKRYLQIASGARPHIPVDPHAPLTAYQEIAGRHPVFQIRADQTPARSEDSA